MERNNPQYCKDEIFLLLEKKNANDAFSKLIPSHGLTIQQKRCNLSELAKFGNAMSRLTVAE